MAPARRTTTSSATTRSPRSSRPTRRASPSRCRTARRRTAPRHVLPRRAAGRRRAARRAKAAGALRRAARRRRALPDHRAGRGAAYGVFVHGRHRPDLRPAPTSRAWSSATRTSSSRRCASGSRRPRRCGHLLSPGAAAADRRGDELHAALGRHVDAAGPPAGDRRRPDGRTHAIWLCRPGADSDELLALAGGGELVVADGNHRSLAAQTGGSPLPRRGHDRRDSVRDPALQPAGQRAAASASTSCSTAWPRRGLRGRGAARGRRPSRRRATRSMLHLRGRPDLRGCGRTGPRPASRRGQPRPRAGRAALFARRRSASTRATSGSPTSAATTRREWLRGEVDAGRAELAVAHRRR